MQAAGPTLGGGQREHVGEVVLALRIAVADPGQPALEVAGGGGEHAGVDPADGALFRRGVLVFDDGLHAACVVEQYATIARRIVERLGEQGEACVASRAKQARERGRQHQRHVAEQHQHLGVVGDVRQGLQHGMPGAELARLVRPAEVGAGEGSLYLRSAMSMHHVDARRPQRRSTVDHVREHRPASQRLQHLGQGRFHPLALAGGEDHDVQGRTHAQCSGDAQV